MGSVYPRRGVSLRYGQLYCTFLSCPTFGYALLPASFQTCSVLLSNRCYSLSIALDCTLPNSYDTWVSFEDPLRTRPEAIRKLRNGSKTIQLTAISP